MKNNISYTVPLYDSVGFAPTKRCRIWIAHSPSRQIVFVVNRAGIKSTRRPNMRLKRPRVKVAKSGMAKRWPTATCFMMHTQSRSKRIVKRARVPTQRITTAVAHFFTTGRTRIVARCRSSSLRDRPTTKASTTGDAKRTATTNKRVDAKFVLPRYLPLFR